MSRDRTPESSKKVIPFAPSKSFRNEGRDEVREEVRDEGDPMDRSGQAIISLLQQAADTANNNCDRAMELAHKLSMQLRAAEERIRELESDVSHYHDRAQRAEKWLARIYKDIEEKFFDPQSGRFEQR
jgi:chromosome segregation ATPase